MKESLKLYEMKFYPSIPGLIQTPLKSFKRFEDTFVVFG